MAVIIWSLNILADGVFQALGHDHKPFEPAWGSNYRGFPMADGLCAALCEMRAGQLECITALGFKRWDNMRSPCFCCNVVKDCRFNFPLSIGLCSWADKDPQ
eukprot:7594751-Pyramimonas_sp.AAC.1